MGTDSWGPGIIINKVGPGHKAGPGNKVGSSIDIHTYIYIFMLPIAYCLLRVGYSLVAVPYAPADAYASKGCVGSILPQHFVY